MGWLQTNGGSQRPQRRVIPYHPDADGLAAAVADDLAYYHAQAIVDRAQGPDTLCILRLGGGWEWLLPGHQLVIGVDGGWRIEPVPDTEQVA